jgi:hypothetical protein
MEISQQDAADLWQMTKLIFLDVEFKISQPPYGELDPTKFEIPDEYFKLVTESLPFEPFLVLAPVIRNLMEQFLTNLPTNEIDFEQLSKGPKRILSTVLEKSVARMNSELVQNHTGDVSEAVKQMALVTSHILRVAQKTLKE